MGLSVDMRASVSLAVWEVRPTPRWTTCDAVNLNGWHGNSCNQSILPSVRPMRSNRRLPER
jgi:hypothetical protein